MHLDKYRTVSWYLCLTLDNLKCDSVYGKGQQDVPHELWNTVHKLYRHSRRKPPI